MEAKKAVQGLIKVVLGRFKRDIELANDSYAVVMVVVSFGLDSVCVLAVDAFLCVCVCSQRARPGPGSLYRVFAITNDVIYMNETSPALETNTKEHGDTQHYLRA